MTSLAHERLSHSSVSSGMRRYRSSRRRSWSRPPVAVSSADFRAEYSCECGTTWTVKFGVIAFVRRLAPLSATPTALTTNRFESAR